MMRFCTTLSLAALLGVLSLPAVAAPLEEPLAFASRAGVLDLVMVAKPLPVTLAGFTPTGWVYEVCPRTQPEQRSCPLRPTTVHPYGGVRLQLQAGDELKIRLVNQLPPAPAEAKHVPEMPDMLAQNPTNLHTHGLIVEPRRASAHDRTWGDYIYVYGYQANNAPAETIEGLDFTDAPIDYDIRIPSNHPSGLYWFHPHVHGLSLNQISAGLAGMITIGDPADYVSSQRGGRPAVRHLILKDTQILPDGTLKTQQDSAFCDGAPASSEDVRTGFCKGVDPYVGGKWVFSVNGQVYPELEVREGAGEVWRLLNASGSRTYKIALEDDATNQEIPLQVVAIDGVAIDGPESTGAIPAAQRASRIQRVPCAASAPANAVCASSVVMMPSSRVEVWVPSSPNGRNRPATLVTDEFDTGAGGDDWPEISLAHVKFLGDHGASAARVSGNAARLRSSRGALGVAPSGPVTTSDEKADCAALPSGHRRRIFFGLPSSNPAAFGLGYEELDSNGTPVPGTFKDIEAFDHTGISVCLPLGRDNAPVTETWELVNVANEDHNFHIHQTKFRVLSGAQTSSQLGAMMDNVPLPNGGPACDTTIANWRAGNCPVRPVVVSIPFSQLGDFVYHCHILEHEDGGMMAHIRVVPAK